MNYSYSGIQVNGFVGCSNIFEMLSYTLLIMMRRLIFPVFAYSLFFIPIDYTRILKYLWNLTLYTKSFYDITDIIK